MGLITSPADTEIMQRFGLNEDQWETMQDHANQLLGELQERSYPPVCAYLALRYACHMAAVQSGMPRTHMLTIDADMDLLLHDAARWHFDEITRAHQKPNEEDAEVGVYPH